VLLNIAPNVLISSFSNIKMIFLMNIFFLELLQLDHHINMFYLFLLLY